MEPTQEVEDIMASLWKSQLGAEIYNPIYEAVVVLLRGGGRKVAERLIAAVYAATQFDLDD